MALGKVQDYGGHYSAVCNRFHSISSVVHEKLSFVSMVNRLH